MRVRKRGVVVGRLQMPDAAQLSVQGDPAALHETRETIDAKDARPSNAADMFPTGHKRDSADAYHRAATRRPRTGRCIGGGGSARDRPRRFGERRCCCHLGRAQRGQ